MVAGASMHVNDIPVELRTTTVALHLTEQAG